MKNLDYDFVLELKKHFEERSSKNPSYSLRAFARDLAILPSRLSEILNYKKGLSEEAANTIAQKLGLSKTETEIFSLSAKSLYARSLKEREAASELLKKKVKTRTPIHKLDMKDFELANNWYHLAILELLELENCEHKLEWFSKKLNLNIAIIKSAIERLQKIGWIKYKNKKYSAVHEQSETSYDISSDIIKKYHSELLKRAEHSLYFDGINEREFLNMTLSFAHEDMQEAKEAIRQFQKEFGEKFYSRSKAKDSVYQLSMQFFRIDRAIEEK